MKTNGLNFFIVSTIILFTAVFAMSKLFYKDTEEITADETDSIVTTASQPAEATPDESDASDNKAPVHGSDLPADDVTDVTAETSETAETTIEAAPTPREDPADADNTWAMFLVNQTNPVSAEYCNGIETSEIYESWRVYYMDSRASEYAKQMIKAASADGVELIVMSAFRTMDYQQNNFDKSVEARMTDQGMTYEEAYADTLKEVQLPGYSEHNAGVAADIMSDEYVSMDDDGFENTEAFKWLTEHAAEYGFILRYPKGKEDVTGIIYEPWHYRFVGVYYAKEISDEGITLEEYFEEMSWADKDGKAVYHIPELES